jgi:secreted protein with Ig-like and vWFA domain
VACALLSACGNLTAGGRTGDATVTVSGDGFDALAAPQSMVGPHTTPPLRMSGNGPKGEVQAEFFISLVTATGASVSLSEDPIRIRLDVEGLQKVDAVDRQIIPAMLYTEIQIVFTDIRVDVTEGLIINGVPVVGEVRVELKDTALTVTRPLTLDVEDGESVFLLLDLNANTWLQAVDPVLKVIAEEVFGDAVSVGVP